MAQLALFQIASCPHSYEVATTPEIERALADHAPVAIGVSGGKDSSAVAIRTFEYLDDCGHRGPRLLIHCDLGEIEWAESLHTCERLAASIGAELLVVRRGAGGLLARWRQRWENNKQRYARLQCVRVIIPWSSAAARFCTSELKTAIACRALAKRFVGRPILSVTGVRRAESVARLKAAVCAPQQRLIHKRAGTSGWDWHPILHWSHAEVFAFLRERNQPLHVAYSVYGCSRVFCAFCVLSSGADLAAASRCESNQNVYRQLVALEAESSFPFQPGRWLGDVAPHLLSADVACRLARAKDVARQREALEAQIPEDLLLSNGVPGRLPTRSEAELLASIRRQMSALLGFKVAYQRPEEVLARYRQLLSAK
jgi:3'-phosphoadenosine 5'-phosphosulfate sulfotransferase (PAPS reductase)/FAD synthetase